MKFIFLTFALIAAVASVTSSPPFLTTMASAQNENSSIGVGKPQQSVPRVALIIGNSNYSDSPLANPVNDARAMSQTLRSLGFAVIHGENLSYNEMKRYIRDFGDKIRNGGVGLFYYAGHGIQIDGRNYLIPIGAAINKETEVEYESVDLGFVLAQMEDARNKLNIIILDACRNNPFARNFRSLKVGLASINAPRGTLIEYATAPGSVASDGTGRNGLYTQELLRYIRQDGLSIEQVFKLVRGAVQDKTNGTQIPWESSSLIGDFYFSPITSPEKNYRLNLNNETAKLTTEERIDLSSNPSSNIPIDPRIENPDSEKLIRDISVDGKFDAYSAYLSPKQVSDYDPRASRGETGMILSRIGEYPLVVAVLKGSPAAQVGIRESDSILYVEKVSSRDLSLYDINQMLSGQPGTKVQIGILRQGQFREFDITRARIMQPPVESRIIERSIGYILVTSLVEDKVSEIRSQVKVLLSRGVKKIVLDLRGAANGNIHWGAAVANIFVGSGTLARVIGKGNREIMRLIADPENVLFTGPLVIVIDGSTAGPAEIIAAAVKEQKRGELVGVNTFGAGAEQQLFSLSDGGALLLTTSKYAPASGIPFMERSVAPTIRVEKKLESNTRETTGDDIQLTKALEIIKRFH